MGAKSGIALKSVQWFIRGVQFCCAALVLSLFSYFLATLSNHHLATPTWVRAVEGISGIAVVYTAVALLLLCCLAGHPITSFLAIALDVCFIGGFIYIAIVNRGGASSCQGYVNTPYGSGDSATNVVDDGNGGFTTLPSLHQACQLETACLAVSIVAIFFFIFSILMEVVLARHRSKEKRFGPGPNNGYTSGSGKQGGFLSSFRRKRATGLSTDTNALPSHTHPDQVRDSYATEQTRVGTAAGHSKHETHAPLSTANGTTHGDLEAAPGTHNNYGNSGYGHISSHHPAMTSTHGSAPVGSPATAHYPPANYRYEDGVYDTRR